MESQRENSSRGIRLRSVRNSHHNERLMESTHRPLIGDIRNFISCCLCRGILRRAVTITTCLHSFCKKCLERHLRRSKACPKCLSLIHPLRPSTNIRLDRILERFVYKLFPDLFKHELEKRKRKLLNKPKRRREVIDRPDVPEMRSRREFDEKCAIFTGNESVSLCLQLRPSLLIPQEKDRELRLCIRYLLCPSLVTIDILKRFILDKFTLGRNIEVNIFYKDNLLADNYTLIDVVYIYGWGQVQPMLLSYSFLQENSSLRSSSAGMTLSCEEPTTTTTTVTEMPSLSNSSSNSTSRTFPVCNHSSTSTIPSGAPPTLGSSITSAGASAVFEGRSSVDGGTIPLCPPTGKVHRKRGRKQRRSWKTLGTSSPTKKKFRVQDNGPGFKKTFLSVADPSENTSSVLPECSLPANDDTTEDGKMNITGSGRTLEAKHGNRNILGSGKALGVETENGNITDVDKPMSSEFSTTGCQRSAIGGDSRIGVIENQEPASAANCSRNHKSDSPPIPGAEVLDQEQVDGNKRPGNGKESTPQTAEAGEDSLAILKDRKTAPESDVTSHSGVMSQRDVTPQGDMLQRNVTSQSGAPQRDVTSQSDTLPRVVTSQRDVTSQREVTSQSGVLSQNTVMPQGGMTSPSGVTSQCGATSQRVSSQRDVTSQSAMTSEPAISAASKRTEADSSSAMLPEKTDTFLLGTQACVPNDMAPITRNPVLLQVPDSTLLDGTKGTQQKTKTQTVASCPSVVIGQFESVQPGKAVDRRFNVSQMEKGLCPKCGRKEEGIDGTSVSSSSRRCNSCLSISTSITVFINHSQGKMVPEELHSQGRKRLVEELARKTAFPGALKVTDDGGNLPVGIVPKIECPDHEAEVINNPFCQAPAQSRDLSRPGTKRTCGGQRSRDDSSTADSSAVSAAVDRCPATSAPLTGNRFVRKQKSLESIIRALQPRQMSPAVQTPDNGVTPKPSQATPSLFSALGRAPTPRLVATADAKLPGAVSHGPPMSILRRELTNPSRASDVTTNRFLYAIKPDVTSASQAPPIKRLKNMYDGLDPGCYRNPATSKGENRRHLPAAPNTPNPQATVRDTGSSSLCATAVPEVRFLDTQACDVTRRYPALVLASTNGLDAPLELTTKESRDRKWRETGRKSDGDVLRTSFPLFDNRR